MNARKITYPIHEVSPYINWVYFFHAFGFQPRFAQIANIHGCDVCRASWLANFPSEEINKAAEAMQLFKEANKMIDLLDRDYKTYGLFQLFPAYSEGDDIVTDCGRIPLLRQQHIKKEGDPYLCLSDFISPDKNGKDPVNNTLGIFATTVDDEMEHLYEKDPYKHMLTQILADRLAEATAEKLHEEVRTTFWGYAPDEKLPMEELLLEHYQGIRPAVGYPSLPDQSVNFILDSMIGYDNIGIRVTENGAMLPHASVSGLMLAHPASTYFSIGTIDKDQLENYAKRRGKDIGEIKKYLAANIK